MKITLMPIDVGFDVRALQIPVDINPDTDSVVFLDKNNVKRTISGDIDVIYRELIRNGFKLK
jgi:hypothetical protein